MIQPNVELEFLVCTTTFVKLSLVCKTSYLDQKLENNNWKKWVGTTVRIKLAQLWYFLEVWVDMKTPKSSFLKKKKLVGTTARIKLAQLWCLSWHENPKI